MNNYLTIATECALEAGKIIEASFHKSTRIDAKGEYDVVTQADYDSELAIIERLRFYLPEHSIISEEAGKLLHSSEYIWIIDPLDGTGNFITGKAYFAVSIALAMQGKVITGVVYNPITKELYTAEKGKGAFLDKTPLRVSSRSLPNESYAATAYAATPEAMDEGINILSELSRKYRRVVLNFAPALDLCNIARGKIDLLVDNGSTCEDHAAGSLILEEAGGKVKNLHQAGWDVYTTGIVASNGLHGYTME